ncbi:hypothetical protein KKG45_06405 [bacterium]|nr:hypothetical protein [bacterium]MBU1072859.1 hypothetical protein [bacterium]
MKRWGRGRRASAPAPAGRESWALWNLRALAPGATATTLASLRARRREIAELQHRVLAGGEGDVPHLLGDAEAVLAAHPGLRGGLVVTLHMGPYTLTPALLVMAGERPAVLLDAEAHAAIRPRAEQQRRMLDLPGEIDWIVVDKPLFVKKVLKALREGRPVVAYLDGNRGAGGTEATRDKGMPYRLPGRTIRLRTGLGRLIARTGCSVHAVAARWQDDGTIDWHVSRLGPWPDPAIAGEVTRDLYDWLFAQVIRTPEQWSYWGMLAASSDCFATENLAVSDPREHARRNAEFLDCLVRRPQQSRLSLSARVEVWDPDILVDLDHDAFYGAEGLTEVALDLLRGLEPTLADLCDACGRKWVGFHGRRLYLLGLAELKVTV